MAGSDVTQRARRGAAGPAGPPAGGRRATSPGRHVHCRSRRNPGYGRGNGQEPGGPGRGRTTPRARRPATRADEGVAHARTIHSGPADSVRVAGLYRQSTTDAVHLGRPDPVRPPFVATAPRRHSRGRRRGDGDCAGRHPPARARYHRPVHAPGGHSRVDKARSYAVLRRRRRPGDRANRAADHRDERAERLRDGDAQRTDRARHGPAQLPPARGGAELPARRPVRARPERTGRHGAPAGVPRSRVRSGPAGRDDTALSLGRRSGPRRRRDRFDSHRHLYLVPGLGCHGGRLPAVDLHCPVRPPA